MTGFRAAWAWGAAAAAVGLVSLAAENPSPDSIGYVVKVYGDWNMVAAASSAPTPLAQWQELPAGCRVAPATKEGQCTLFLTDGKTVVCEAAQPETWSAPLALGGADESGGKLVRLAMRWLTKKPQVLMPAMSRGGETQSALRDQVVQWSEKGIDPASLLGPDIKDPSNLRFEPLSAEGAPIEGAAPVLVKWAPGLPSPARATLAPGLYNLVVLNQFNLRTGRDAWVLVAKPEAYAQAAPRFQELSAMAASWNETDPRSARGFLRASLLALSETPESGQP